MKTFTDYLHIINEMKINDRAWRQSLIDKTNISSRRPDKFIEDIEKLSDTYNKIKQEVDYWEKANKEIPSKLDPKKYKIYKKEIDKNKKEADNRLKKILDIIHTKQKERADDPKIKKLIDRIQKQIKSSNPLRSLVNYALSHWGEKGDKFMNFMTSKIKEEGKVEDYWNYVFDWEKQGNRTV